MSYYTGLKKCQTPVRTKDSGMGNINTGPGSWDMDSGNKETLIYLELGIGFGNVKLLSQTNLNLTEPQLELRVTT